jgi:hypothetical protein
MADDNDNQPQYEGEAILLHTRVQRLEEQRAEANKTDERYKEAQLEVDRGQLRNSTSLKWFTLLLVVCTITTSFIAIWQARISKRSADAAVSAATAAITANKDARDRFQQDQRPYLWVKDPGTPEFVVNPNTNPQTGQIIWTYHFTNYGRTPAYKVITYKFIRVGKTAEFKESFGFSKATVGEGVPAPPNVDDFMTVVSEAGISPAKLEQLTKTDEAIAIRLRIEYTDAYGSRYETGVCVHRLANGATQYCREGNYIH